MTRGHVDRKTHWAKPYGVWEEEEASSVWKHRTHLSPKLSLSGRCVPGSGNQADETLKALIIQARERNQVDKPVTPTIICTVKRQGL